MAFTFPDTWTSVKYDETKFYKDNIISTAANLKAVDILAIPYPQRNSLLMIEVKDFRGHAKENQERQGSGKLVVEVIEKAMHTLSALYLVKYCGNSELAAFVAPDLTPPPRIELVLFMEEDPIVLRHDNDTKSKMEMQNMRNRIDNMTLSFRQKLKDKVKISSKIISTASIKARDVFTVAQI